MPDTISLLSYFRTESEAMHLAIETQPHVWEPLNGNKPVLTGEVGTKTLRDPFLFRDRQGLFHILSTDGWKSPNIVHATSEDLIRWSPQDLVPIMGAIPGTHNAWAPECFWDMESGHYRLIWSSSMEGPTAGDNRIWSSFTLDFRTYSQPEIYFDPGYNVIDATVFPTPERDYMVFKDEWGSWQKEGKTCALRTTTRERGTTPFTAISAPFSPLMVEGPIIRRADGVWVVYYDFFHAGHWGASASHDFKSWREIPLTMPFGPRHGSVIDVPTDVAQKLRAHFA